MNETPKTASGNTEENLKKYEKMSFKTKSDIYDTVTENINPEITKKLINLLENEKSTDAQIVEEININIYKLHINSIDVLSVLNESNLSSAKKNYIRQQISN